MNNKRFWDIVDLARPADPLRASDRAWSQNLQAELERLPADEIVEWNHIFDRLAADAYTVDLWGASYLINGGSSDDGFYYFRCWLIGMGQRVYETAVAEPDALANLGRLPEMAAEAEMYAAAHQAWMKVTGHSDKDPYPARNESAMMTGEDWNFDDAHEARRHLPRLADIYLS